MNFFVTNKTNINLTGNQIATLLDNVAFQILYSLNLFTEVLEPNMVQMLSWISDNRRKKICSIPRDEQLRLLYNYLFTNDIDVRYTILCTLHIDRFYIRKLAAVFIDKTKNYKQLYKKFIAKELLTVEEQLQMRETEAACKCSKEYLYPLILNLEQYLVLYKDLTDIIISKYYKFLWSMVKKRVHSTTRHFDENELYQNYISAALKAFDRYDPEKGALTSYIQLWIKNNQQSAEESPEYSITYAIPPTQLGKQTQDSDGNRENPEENFSVSLDSILTDGELSSETVLGQDSHCPEKRREETDSQELLLKLAKYADPIGIARLSLGIHEYLEDETRLLMERTMKETGILPDKKENC